MSFLVNEKYGQKIMIRWDKISDYTVGILVPNTFTNKFTECLINTVSALALDTLNESNPFFVLRLFVSSKSILNNRIIDSAADFTIIKNFHFTIPF